jgi:polyhydroxybutyrate depolymerase
LYLRSRPNAEIEKEEEISMRRFAIPGFPRFLAVFSVLLIVSCGGGGGGGGGSGAAPSGLSYPSPQTYTLNSAITTLTPTVTGSVSSYSVSPPLPAGLVLDAASGEISGTPSVTSATADYVVTASNSAGSASFDLSITVDNTSPFWLEPSVGTVIGVGQLIYAFPAYQANASDPYPAYVDPTLVSWSSSNPVCASVGSDGAIVGLSACSTVITATYLGNTSQLTVQVSGTWVNRSVAVAGQGTRAYSIYIPDFGGDTRAHPAMISIHGGGGTAMIQASTSQLVKLAKDKKTYIAFLEGSGVIQTFNAGACCGYAQTNNIDDVLYAQDVLDDIEGTDNVDTTRVFATGFSNGGMMSHRLACAMADRLAGIAAVSGASAEFDQNLTQYYTCNPARPIPILHIHATNDRNYPYAGGPGDGLSSTLFYPVDSTIADWRARNNVTSQASVERVTATTTCYRYATPSNAGLPSAPVTLCKIDPVDVYDATNEIVFGGGHSWPGGVRSPAAKSDVPLMDFNANEYIWNFLNP